MYFLGLESLANFEKLINTGSVESYISILEFVYVSWRVKPRQLVEATTLSHFEKLILTKSKPRFVTNGELHHNAGGTGIS